MKNSILFLSFTLFSCFAFSQQTKTTACKPIPFDVALSDNLSESFSNIRETPNGNIMLKLDNQLDYYILTVIDIKDGWLKINTVESVNYGYIISEIDGWIHHSIVDVSARRNLKLRNEVDGNTIVGTIEQEKFGIKIIGLCSNWVQIEYNDFTGWIESKWLCGNPVTTCP